MTLRYVAALVASLMLLLAQNLLVTHGIVNRFAIRRSKVAAKIVSLVTLLFCLLSLTVAADLSAEVFINNFPTDVSISEGDPLDLPVFFYGNDLTGKPTEIFIWVESTEIPELKAFFSASGWSLFNSFEEIAPVLGLDAMLDFANVTWPMFGNSPALKFKVNICLDGTVDGKLPGGPDTPGISCGSRVINIAEKPKQDCTGIFVFENGAQTNSISRTAAAGSNEAAALTVRNSCSEPIEFEYTTQYNTGQGWIVAATQPGVLTLSLLSTGLQASATPYTGVISLTSGTASTDVAVNFTVNSQGVTCNYPPPFDAFCRALGGGGAPTACTPSSLSVFSADISAAAGETKEASVPVKDNCGTSVSYTASVTQGAQWLSAQQSGAGTLALTATTAGLASGTSYIGKVEITSPGYNTAALTVALTITGPCIPSYAVMTPASPSKNVTVGTVADSIPVTVTDNCSNPLSFTVGSVTYTTGSGWITSPVQGATGTGTLTVDLNTASLTAGVYSATIGITPAVFAPMTIPVTLTVGTTPPPTSAELIAYARGSAVMRTDLPPGGTKHYYFEVPAYTRDPLIVKMEDYCDGAMIHQMDMLVRYAGPTCDGILPTVQDIDAVVSFCSQYAATDGCRLKWLNGAYHAPRYSQPGKDFYYDLTSTAFETVVVAGDPLSPDKDNPIGCYYVIVHNNDTVTTCPGVSIQDF